MRQNQIIRTNSLRWIMTRRLVPVISFASRKFAHFQLGWHWASWTVGINPILTRLAYTSLTKLYTTFRGC